MQCSYLILYLTNIFTVPGASVIPEYSITIKHHETQKSLHSLSHCSGNGAHTNGPFVVPTYILRTYILYVSRSGTNTSYRSAMWQIQPFFHTFFVVFPQLVQYHLTTNTVTAD